MHLYDWTVVHLYDWTVVHLYDRTVVVFLYKLNPKFVFYDWTAVNFMVGLGFCLTKWNI